MYSKSSSHAIGIALQAFGSFFSTMENYDPHEVHSTFYTILYLILASLHILKSNFICIYDNCL